MRVKKSILSLVLAAGMILSFGCESEENVIPDTASIATDVVTESDESSSIEASANETTAAVTAALLSEVDEMEFLDKLSLCVTEGGVEIDRDSIFRRFAEYKELGITCVRVDTSWSSPYYGTWNMGEKTENYLEAAREYGLLLKLILPTIMGPPAWISSEEGARLVDYNGRESINTVSYWYEDITEYTDMAVRAMLEAIVDSGYSDVIGGVVVDMGPAGEPLYPPAWTQAESDGAEVMWCYGDNAQEDFRVEMKEKYSTIEAANSTWGSSYDSFGAINVPKPGDVKGALWEDVLTWYRDTKREFMTAQVGIFKAALADYNLAGRPLIIYLPGADYTQQQWDYCVENGTAISNIMFSCDNNFTVDLAAEKGCLLQYTGITGQQGLRLLREYMYVSGNSDIPVFGENAGDDGQDVELLRDIIIKNKLYGIDYTHCHYLYESDGKTKGERFEPFKAVIAELSEYIETVDLTTAPTSVTGEEAQPEGDILCLSIDFDVPESDTLGYIFVTFATPKVRLQQGDTLEYDLLLSTDMQGLGSIDGNIDGKTMRDGFGMTDDKGIRVHPNADLSDYAYPEWYHRVVEIGNSASNGGTLTELILAAHPEKLDGNFNKVSVKVYYDNIIIKRDGEVIVEIFKNEGDVSLCKPSMTKNAKGSVSVEALDKIE